MRTFGRTLAALVLCAVGALVAMWPPFADAGTDPAAPAAPAALPHRVIGDLRWSPLRQPIGAAVNSVTHKLYVMHMRGIEYELSVFDERSRAQLATIPMLSPMSQWVVVSEKWSRVYVTDKNDPGGTLLIIDGDINRIVGTIDGRHTRIAADPNVAVHDGRNRLYVVEGANNLAVVSTQLDRLVAPFNPGRQPGIAVLVDPTLDRLYLVLGQSFQQPQSGGLKTFDLTTNQPLTTAVGVHGYPAIDTVRHMIYMVPPGQRTITPVNGVSGAAEADIPLSVEVAGYPAVDAARGCLYVLTADKSLLVVDIVGRRELGVLSLGADSRDPAYYVTLGIDADSGRVYIPDPTDFSVHIVQGARCDIPTVPTLEPTAPTTGTPAPTSSPPPPPTPTPSATLSASATLPSTPVPTSTLMVFPTATSTTGPTVTPIRTATRSATEPPMCVCRSVYGRVPRVVIEDAVSNPARYFGWLMPLDPGKPPSPANPPRTCLTLSKVNLDYHPVWNKPQWRVGCP